MREQKNQENEIPSVLPFTKNGKKVIDLRQFENHGYTGTVDNVKMIWDLYGTTGKGHEWHLQSR